jgi:hypothetical protein
MCSWAEVGRIVGSRRDPIDLPSFNAAERKKKEKLHRVAEAQGDLSARQLSTQRTDRKVTCHRYRRKRFSFNLTWKRAESARGLKLVELIDSVALSRRPPLLPLLDVFELLDREGAFGCFGMESTRSRTVFEILQRSHTV